MADIDVTVGLDPSPVTRGARKMGSAFDRVKRKVKSLGSVAKGVFTLQISDAISGIIGRLQQAGKEVTNLSKRFDLAARRAAVFAGGTSGLSGGLFRSIVQNIQGRTGFQASEIETAETFEALRGFGKRTTEEAASFTETGTRLGTIFSGVDRRATAEATATIFDRFKIGVRDRVGFRDVVERAMFDLIKDAKLTPQQIRNVVERIDPTKINLEQFEGIATTAAEIGVGRRQIPAIIEGFTDALQDPKIDRTFRKRFESGDIGGAIERISRLERRDPSGVEEDFGPQLVRFARLFQRDDTLAQRLGENIANGFSSRLEVMQAASLVSGGLAGDIQRGEALAETTLRTIGEGLGGAADVGTILKIQAAKFLELFVGGGSVVTPELKATMNSELR